MRKFLFSVVCAVMALQSAGAQLRITGRCVSADDDSAVGYVTVSAMRDSTCIAANCADGNGRFSLTVDKAAAYKMTFSMLGYRSVVREVEVEGNTDMGDIVMEEGEQLEGVEIVVQKPLVTHTAEKLTYEVENDPQAATATLDEILRKVPQLSINAEGKVLVNGESGYKVLVNGHSQGSISRNFDEIIKSMPASSIKRIEVITNPGIKYDAEGTAGILNIITSSRHVDGFDGSLSDRLTFYPNTYNNINGRIALQSGKFALEVNAYNGYY
ncbi:MAG: TonB-dependent receptor, partial [Alistipes sp.]|nr:TonB-dependent receptor [Alistipes sp.]